MTILSAVCRKNIFLVRNSKEIVNRKKYEWKVVNHGLIVVCTSRLTYFLRIDFSWWPEAYGRQHTCPGREPPPDGPWRSPQWHLQDCPGGDGAIKRTQWFCGASPMIFQVTGHTTSTCSHLESGWAATVWWPAQWPRKVLKNQYQATLYHLEI